MLVFAIKSNSVVSSLLTSDGVNVKNEFCGILSDLKAFAKSENVDVEFRGERAIFGGCCCRTFPVPAKACNDVNYLASWTRKKIQFVNK